MYKVTWIVGNTLKTVTYPNWSVIWDVYAALKNNGECVRIWNKAGELAR